MTERDIERHEARIIDGASERDWEKDHAANELARTIAKEVSRPAMLHPGQAGYRVNKSHALCDQMAGILMDATAKAMGKPRRTT